MPKAQNPSSRATRGLWHDTGNLADGASLGEFDRFVSPLSSLNPADVLKQFALL